MSRLTLLHINLIGFFVAVVVGVALYFTLITGAQKQIEENQSTYNSIKTDADKLPAAQAALKQAQADKKRTEIDYASYNNEFMPILGYDAKDRVKTMIRVWWPNGGRSWPERFISGVKKFMNQEHKRYGVTWLNPEVLALPAYGPDPNSIDMGESGALHFGPYAFSVRGKTYQSLMNHISDWPSIRGLGVPTVEGVTLTGNSPDLVASYNVTFTLIMKEALPPNDNRVAGSGGQGGRFGGAAGFGPPGGRMGGMGMGAGTMMGGPPGVMGGPPGGMSGPPGGMGGPPGGMSGPPGGMSGPPGGMGGRASAPSMMGPRARGRQAE